LRIDLVGTTADFRRPGPRRPLPLNHLPGENRGTAGRIGEVGLVEPEIAEHRGRASSRSPLTVSGPRLVGSVTFPFTKTEITLLATGYRSWKPAFAAECTGPLEPE
jgi:hypothetical protein